jgi:hypothetical protein
MIPYPSPPPVFPALLPHWFRSVWILRGESVMSRTRGRHLSTGRSSHPRPILPKVPPTSHPFPRSTVRIVSRRSACDKSYSLASSPLKSTNRVDSHSLDVLVSAPRRCRHIRKRRGIRDRCGCLSCRKHRMLAGGEWELEERECLPEEVSTRPAASSR